MKPEDLQLLEKAERAAYLPWDQWVEEGNASWNALDDDGDALQLAVIVGVRIETPKYKGFGTTVSPLNGATGVTVFREDRFEQTRRAIVMAAANIYDKANAK